MAPKSKTAQETSHSYAFGDIVLAKIRGFPAWPGMIVDPDNVPEAVSKEKPSKIRNFHCVRFFTAGDYAFPINKDISKLQQHEIEAYIADPVKKGGELLSAYKVAQDPTEWIASKEAEAAAAAEAAANASVDQLEDSGVEAGDADGSGKKKEKKRKREGEGTKKTKTAAPKAKKKAGESGVGKKKTGGASKRVIESEDEAGGDDAGGVAGAKASVPPAKKAKREEDDPMEKDPEAKKVREWRHKLQKVLLNTKSPAKPEDIPGVDVLFTTIEQYDNMTLDYLTFSKIGKVMRHIHQLTDDKLPRNEEFNIRNRAQSLVEKWQMTHFNSASDGANAAEPAKDDSDPVKEVEAEQKPEATKKTGTAKEAEVVNGDHAMILDPKASGDEDVSMATA